MVAVKLGKLVFVVQRARLDVVPRNAETNEPGELMLVLEECVGGPMPTVAHIDEGQLVGADGPHVVAPSTVHAVVGGLDLGAFPICECHSRRDDVLVIRRYV